MQYLVFGDQPQVDCFQSLETVLSAKDAKPLLPFFPLSANISAKPNNSPLQMFEHNLLKNLVWIYKTHKNRCFEKMLWKQPDFCAESFWVGKMLLQTVNDCGDWNGHKYTNIKRTRACTSVYQLNT